MIRLETNDLRKNEFNNSKTVCVRLLNNGGRRQRIFRLLLPLQRVGKEGNSRSFRIGIAPLRQKFNIIIREWLLISLIKI